MEIPKIFELYPALTKAVYDYHQRVGLTASGHDVDHDLEVGQLALIVAWQENQSAAILAGVGGLIHSMDRLLEVELGLAVETISTVSEDDVRSSATSMLAKYTDITDPIHISRVVEAVVFHGSKPNQPEDDLVMIAVADADRLANMGASLPIRSGQHNHNVPLLHPHWIERDLTNRSMRDKYNNPISVFFDIQNAINWYRDLNGPYSLRLARSLEIGRYRAERLERYIQDNIEDRRLVGLYPYPSMLS